jgi:hypothetical protein
MQGNRQNSLTPLDFSRDYFLAREIEGLENAMVEAARNTVTEFIRDQGVSLTDTEMEAAVTIQVLKELNSIDLASLLLRYKYLRKIRDGNLVTRHPGQYASLAEVAIEAGISAAELSRIVDLVEIVFPYLGYALNLDIPTVWKEVGKSNFFDMLPVLKVLITGENVAHSPQANQSAHRFLDDVAAGYRTAGQELPEDVVLRQEVVQDIVEHGRLLNNHEMRTHLRPDHTPNITIFRLEHDGVGVLIASVSDEQMHILTRRAGDCMDVQQIDLAGMRSLMRQNGIL